MLAKFYAANIVLALEHLHFTHSIIHRDLKPQNILVDEHFYLKIIDFGDSKMLTEEEVKRVSDYRSNSVGSFSGLFKAANERDAMKI